MKDLFKVSIPELKENIIVSYLITLSGFFAVCVFVAITSLI